MERKRVLAVAGKLVPYMGERDVCIRRRSRDDSGNDRLTPLFISDAGIWDNGIKAIVRPGPVSVPWTDYYQRQHRRGDLVIVADKAKPREEKSAASRGSDARRDSAGGES
jgi:hypothetical protein